MNDQRPFHRLNVVLFVVLLALLTLNWGLGRATGERNVEFMPEMVDSVAAEAFSAHSGLPLGMTMQTPPPGTIPRGYPPLGFTATPEDAVRAGQELKNPFSADDAVALARGQDIFQRYCMLCHGATGVGDGIVAQRGFPAPPSFLAVHARELADGQIFHIITYGQANMPGHAAQLDRADRWRAVLRVRELQAAAPVEPDAVPGAAPGAAPDAAPDTAPAAATEAVTTAVTAADPAAQEVPL